MPIGPDTDRQGSGRIDRDTGLLRRWLEDNDYSRHSGHEQHYNPAGFELGGMTVQEYEASVLRHPAGNDLGDLVDPQDGTYEEEGTHGLPLLAAAAPMLGRMAGMAATSFGMKAGSNLADKVTGGGGGSSGGGGGGGSMSY